jgi:copper transporter 1
MHMLWNTNIVDTCIVFRQWHIGSTTALVFSCLAIAALCVLYEYLRACQRTVDARIAAALARNSKRASAGRSTPEREAPADTQLLLSARGGPAAQPRTRVPPAFRAARAALYGAVVGLSFFLMLVFMTYNAYLIAAVVAGATLGHYVFGGVMDVEAVLLAAGDGGRGMACH